MKLCRFQVYNYIIHHLCYMSFFFNLLIWGRERNTLICYSTYQCIYWLFPPCTLTGDQIWNVGVSGQHSNHLSHPAGVIYVFRTRLAHLNFSGRKNNQEKHGNLPSFCHPFCQMHTAACTVHKNTGVRTSSLNLCSAGICCQWMLQLYCSTDKVWA